MKLWNWFLKCPILFLLLAAWLGLTAFTWSEGRISDVRDKDIKDIIENPLFTALLESEPDTVLGGLDIEISDLDADDDDSGRPGSDHAGPGGKDSGREADDQEAADQKNSNQKDSDQKNSNQKDPDQKDSNQEDLNQGTSDQETAGQGASGKENSNDTATGKDTDKETDQESSGSAQGAAASNSGNGKGSAGTDSAGKSETAGLNGNIKAGITKFKSYKKIQTDSQYYSDPGKKALTTEFAYEKVNKSYFDDAVFIGDSRTVGMQDYSGLDNASFFAKTGMNVYEVLEDKFIKDPDSGKDVSVAHMLKTNKYSKIYFMVGINELGTGNTGTFQKAYDRVLRKFRKWQPDAVIYIQGIIPVSEEKASEDAIFNNVNINDKNVAIAQLANGLDTFYLDVSGKLTDKDGYLRKDYTFDHVHMYAQYYELWTNYLMKHAVVRK